MPAFSPRDRTLSLHGRAHRQEGGDQQTSTPCSRPPPAFRLFVFLYSGVYGCIPYIIRTVATGKWFDFIVLPAVYS
jgi:hypothetical protein